jgi:hypothetical protein
VADHLEIRAGELGERAPLLGAVTAAQHALADLDTITA